MKIEKVESYKITVSGIELLLSESEVEDLYEFLRDEIKRKHENTINLSSIRFNDLYSYSNSMVDTICTNISQDPVWNTKEDKSEGYYNPHSLYNGTSTD